MRTRSSRTSARIQERESINATRGNTMSIFIFVISAIATAFLGDFIRRFISGLLG